MREETLLEAEGLSNEAKGQASWVGGSVEDAPALQKPLHGFTH